MTIITDVFKELFKMFVADIGLTSATLASVVLVALLLGYSVLPPVYGGPLLLILSVVVLLEAVFRETRRRSSGK
jgi:hypothetical protein